MTLMIFYIFIGFLVGMLIGTGVGFEIIKEQTKDDE